PSIREPTATRTRTSARSGWSRSSRRYRGAYGPWSEPSGFARCAPIQRPQPSTVSACSTPCSSRPRASAGCPKPSEPSPRHLNSYHTRKSRRTSALFIFTPHSFILCIFSQVNKKSNNTQRKSEPRKYSRFSGTYFIVNKDRYTDDHEERI